MDCPHSKRAAADAIDLQAIVQWPPARGRAENIHPVRFWPRLNWPFRRANTSVARSSKISNRNVRGLAIFLHPMSSSLLSGS
jgi:hypothetical protein